MLIFRKGEGLDKYKSLYKGETFVTKFTYITVLYFKR